MHNINSRVEDMPWPQTGATQYHAQLRFPDKGLTIKGVVVSYLVELGSMKDIGLTLLN